RAAPGLLLGGPVGRSRSLVRLLGSRLGLPGLLDLGLLRDLLRVFGLRRLGRLLGRRLAGRLLGCALGRYRLLRRLLAADERGVGDAVEHPLDAHLRLLADHRSGVADDDRQAAVELADAGTGVVAADLDELQLDLLALLRGTLVVADEALERALAEHLEVVDRHVLAEDEQEAPLGLLLDRQQPGRAGPDERRGNPGVQLDLEGLRARRARRERAEMPLDVDRGRGLGEHNAVAAAD